ncbi:MAG: hypothetical protein R6W72_02835 [Desulfurivibrionaceae bacterium]
MEKSLAVKLLIINIVAALHLHRFERSRIQVTAKVNPLLQEIFHQ